MSQNKLKEIVKYGDIGTPERHKRKELITDVVQGQKRTRVRNKSPLELYRNKSQITADQLAAGEKLYNSYIVGWVGFGNCEYREPVDGGSKTIEMSDRQVHCQREFTKGMKAAGIYWDIIEKVCLNETFISDIHIHWYTRKKEKARLCKGLDKMAKVYGFK